MPIHCQCVLWADGPAANRFEGTSSSKKATSHKAIKSSEEKSRKRTGGQRPVRGTSSEVNQIFVYRLGSCMPLLFTILREHIMFN